MSQEYKIEKDTEAHHTASEILGSKYTWKTYHNGYCLTNEHGEAVVASDVCKDSTTAQFVRREGHTIFKELYPNNNVY